MVRRINLYCYFCAIIQKIMEIKDKFAKAILQLRHRDLKLSQRDVADEADISLKYYQKLEAGKSVPSIVTLEKLARSHSMSLSELCGIIERTD